MFSWYQFFHIFDLMTQNKTKTDQKYVQFLISHNCFREIKNELYLAVVLSLEI